MPRSAAVAAYLLTGAIAVYASVRENVSRGFWWGSGIGHTLVGLAALHHGDLALRALSASAFLAAAVYCRLRANAKIAACAASASSSPPRSSGPAAAT
jgi:hypothetical protein